MKKKQLEAKLSIAERQLFLNVYNEFDKWLISIGFRMARWNEYGGMNDNNSWVNEIDSMYSVEAHIHETLNLKIRFMREQNKHVFYLVGGWMQRSSEFTLEEMKADILKEVKRLRDEKLKKLTVLAHL